MKVKKKRSVFLYRSLIVVLMINSFQFLIFSQETVNWERPFTKCWEFLFESNTNESIASDNNNNIIFADKFNRIFSIDIKNGKENWRSMIGGNSRIKLILDKNTIFVLSLINENNLISIYSIDSTTGITNWRVETESLEQLTVLQNNDQLFLIDTKGVINSFYKIDGKRNWTKKLSVEVKSVMILNPTQILVFTDKELIKLSTKEGTILETFENNIISQKLSTILFIDESGKDFISGNSTGDLFYFNLKTNKSLWSIKIGGSVSSLLNTDFGLLVSSLDNFIYLFDLKNGKLKWRKRVSGRISITPAITKNYAVILNSSTNIALIIDLKNGKNINQISINENDIFLNKPLIFNDLIVFRTYSGIFAFSNTGCK